jgi:hypothetical protein
MVPASGKRSAQVRQASCLTSFGRTTLFYDYGPFVSEVIGPNEGICAFLSV